MHPVSAPTPCIHIQCEVSPYLCEKSSPDGLNFVDTCGLDESLEFVGLSPVRISQVFQGDLS